MTIQQEYNQMSNYKLVTELAQLALVVPALKPLLDEVDAGGAAPAETTV